MRNAVVVVVDGLHAGMPGCYGNAWIRTPWIDQLAADGVTFDQALIDTPDLSLSYRSFWRSAHAMVPEARCAEQPSLAEALDRRGVTTALLTDAAAVANHPLAGAMGERLRLQQPGEARVAAEISETWMARCFAAALDRLATPRRPRLLWIHLAGLTCAWDAPWELREQYAEEEDLRPYVGTEPVRRWLEPNEDPDQRTAVRFAYAGQVSALDACLGGFLAGMAEKQLDHETLLIFAGGRGWPLGEHRRMGLDAAPLHNELVQMPLIVRMPDRAAAGARTQALAQPADVGATLRDWFGAPFPRPGLGADSLLRIVDQTSQALRDHACILGKQGERAIRTQAWYLRHAAKTEQSGADAALSQGPVDELYAKPDDRWEVNEVADRAPGIAASLADVLQAFENTATQGKLDKLPPLEESLSTGFD